MTLMPEVKRSLSRTKILLLAARRKSDNESLADVVDWLDSFVIAALSRKGEFQATGTVHLLWCSKFGKDKRLVGDAKAHSAELYFELTRSENRSPQTWCTIYEIFEWRARTTENEVACENNECYRVMMNIAHKNLLLWWNVNNAKPYVIPALRLLD